MDPPADRLRQETRNQRDARELAERWAKEEKARERREQRSHPAPFSYDVVETMIAKAVAAERAELREREAVIADVVNTLAQFVYDSRKADTSELREREAGLKLEVAKLTNAVGALERCLGAERGRVVEPNLKVVN
jgi:hypothetical protein